MSFYIQLSNPRINTISVKNEVGISKFIEDLFPMETEDLMICWNGVRFSLSYKYDIPIIFDDVIQMINNINSSQKGMLNVFWPSNTFRSDWKISWNNENIQCNTIWESVSGNVESVLNRVSSLECTKDYFIGEWIAVLRMIKKKIIKSGVNPNLILEMKELDELLEARRDDIGYLYTIETWSVL
ncbi:hypothetical protein CHU32_08335 [Superficieibacter electus]|uniref:Uncharacterized protein n=1 Tax=Superficieibacter electus TaxID=2022662 RepID=A0A2P5GRE6_9ENTR|nr:hypothetical protein [Superficieibacter electus]POP45808.1 hypothetical protein CHU33_06790 [Superficieibacter electus]POP49114.1 hypothetical protein CHU32_08335 [Superficieibacter electus]